MKSIRIIVSGILAACISCTAQAQMGEAKMTADYSVGIPAGTFSDYIANTSGRGWNVAALYGITDKISIGGSVGFQDFYEKYPRQTYKTTDGSDVSAVLTNSVQVIPVMLTARYNFMPGRTLQPYAGLGVGGNLGNYRQFLGEYSNDSKAKVAFAARPEIGLYIPFSKNKQAGADIGATYQYMPFHYGSMKNTDNIALRVGVSFPLRR